MAKAPAPEVVEPALEVLPLPVEEEAVSNEPKTTTLPNGTVVVDY